MGTKELGFILHRTAKRQYTNTFTDLQPSHTQTHTKPLILPLTEKTPPSLPKTTVSPVAQLSAVQKTERSAVPKPV